MAQSIRDRLTGAILLLFAGIWIAGVFWTIPGDTGVRLGPRGFPFWMGVGLVVLSLILIAGSFVRPAPDDPPAGAVEPKSDARNEIWASASVFGFLAVYALAMDFAGFVIATIAVIAGFLWFVLNKRSPVLLICLPLGLGVGVWYVMGKVMGVYLPRADFVSDLIPFF